MQCRDRIAGKAGGDECDSARNPDTIQTDLASAARWIREEMSRRNSGRDATGSDSAAERNSDQTLLP